MTAPPGVDETVSAPSTAARGGENARRASDRFRRERPRELRHRLAVDLADLASRLIAWLPDRLRDGIADRIGDVWIRLTPVYRANVIANLGQVMGPATSRLTLEAMANQVFRTSARNFGELLRLRHLTPEKLSALLPISIEDLAVFSEARQRGQGIIIATAHMGAFDLIGHAIAAQGVPLTVITGRTTSRFLFDAVTHLRQTHNVTMVEPTPGGVRKVIRALRRGEIAGFLVDYDFFQNGMPVTFFGRETTLPPGPIRIARDTGALVVPIFPRRGRHGHELTLGEPFEVPKTADVDADLAAGMDADDRPSRGGHRGYAGPVGPLPAGVAIGTRAPCPRLSGRLAPRERVLAPRRRGAAAARRDAGPSGRAQRS